MTNQALRLPEHELHQVRDILKKHIPEKIVWAFGSRVTGGKTLKRFSDLDLAIEGKLSIEQRANLAEAFDESLLPIKVDLVELDAIDADFRKRIEKDFIVVQQLAVAA